jgi:hypothetical protein
MTYNGGVKPPMALWETKTFIRPSEELLSPEEDSALKFSLGMEPESGDLIPNTGGARKLRWAIGAEGKRGGVRVVYYFGGDDMASFSSRFTRRGARTI